jgi:hypothetical protein
MSRLAKTKAEINRLIRQFRLEIVGTRGDGYFYFLDLDTGDQIGDSIFVCYLSNMTLAQWISDAEYARKQHTIEHNED